MYRLAQALLIGGVTAVAHMSSAAAAPHDATRPADLELRPCEAISKCQIRGVGDFDGNGFDDLVFSVVATRGRVDGTRRDFEIHLGPFAVDRRTGNHRAAHVVEVTTRDRQRSLDLVIADTDDDGRDDIVLPRTALRHEDAAQVPELAIVLGRNEWPRRIDLGVAAPLVVRLQQVAPTDVGGAQMFFMDHSAAFADVNGDGETDVIWGSSVHSRARHGAPLQAGSVVAVQLGSGPLPATSKFEPDVEISGMGQCATTLGGVGDVTGDGYADVVVRRCAADFPEELRVVPGRRRWPDQIRVDDEIAIPTPGPSPTPLPPGGVSPTPGPRVPPPGGGGYLPPGATAGSSLAFVADINGDRIADAGLEFAGKTHVWFGGPDVAGRVARRGSDAVLLNAELGAMRLSGAWRGADVDADGDADLLLSEPVELDHGLCGRCDAGTAPSGLGAATFMYTHPLPRVLDAALTPAEAVWRSAERVPWGVGDFNADGRDDLLLGSAPSASASEYDIVLGPLVVPVLRPSQDVRDGSVRLPIPLAR